ncbi:MAG: hypothetical protein IJS38_05015 [Erysipelotrichaceae bacterium]|nr:hypothetical protein [Erysipelotrichaceae bacterium]MBQ4251628.1 hypothetical protein [Erysipelotrichaceae bacterium]MBQ7223914.1 hypothetical protein [Erysipelotrichaceae bacterium]
MKTFAKILLILIAFALCYAGVMLFAYNYLYPYPTGYLDEIERADEKLSYKLVYSKYFDDGKTIFYFTRSSNGAGNQMHVGTIESDKNKYIASFFCESTSSLYYPNNAYGYVTTNRGRNHVYLFGSTSDENTVRVEFLFYLTPDNPTVLEATYEDQYYYVMDFDVTLASYSSEVIGYNENDGVTFRYGGPTLSDGSVIVQDK